MTRNQIEYAKLQEAKRANRASEQLTAARDVRSYSVAASQLSELQRHNKQQETIALGTLQNQRYASEATARYQQQQVAELTRANKAREAEIYRSNVAALAEQVRSHTAQETISLRLAQESERSNRAREQYQNASLAEAIRANQASEQLRIRQAEESERSNRASESLRLQQNREQARANRAHEQLQSRQIGIAQQQVNLGLAQLSETNRRNSLDFYSRERQTDEAIRRNQAQEAETARHNAAMEAESNRANLAREAETNRANLADEELRTTEAYRRAFETGTNVFTELGEFFGFSKKRR